MLFFPPFCVLSQRSHSAPCMCIFCDFMTILQQGKVWPGLSQCSVLWCAAKLQSLPIKALPEPSFNSVYIEKFKVNPTRRRWQEAVKFTACVTKSQLVWKSWAGASLFCSAFFSSLGMNFLAGEFWALQVFFDPFVEGSRGTGESWAPALGWGTCQGWGVLGAKTPQMPCPGPPELPQGTSAVPCSHLSWGWASSLFKINNY